MESKVFSPGLNMENFRLPILLGGHGTTTAAEARLVLNMVDAAKFGVPNGIGKLGAGAQILAGELPSEFALTAPLANTITGPTTMEVLTTEYFEITDWNALQNNVVTATGGTVSLNKNIITFTASSINGVGSITLNGRTINVTIWKRVPATPSIIAPSNGSTSVWPSVTLQSTAFTMSSGSDTHQSSSWEVALSPGGSLVSSSYYNSSQKTSYSVNLSTNTTYYARVRHEGTLTGAGNWSNWIYFTTVYRTDSPPSYISLNIPSGAAIRVQQDMGSYTDDRTYTSNTTVYPISGVRRITLIGSGARGGSTFNIGKFSRPASTDPFIWELESESVLTGVDGTNLPLYSAPTTKPTAAGEFYPSVSSMGQYKGVYDSTTGTWKNIQARFKSVAAASITSVNELYWSYVGRVSRNRYSIYQLQEIGVISVGQTSTADVKFDRFKSIVNPYGSAPENKDPITYPVSGEGWRSSIYSGAGDGSYFVWRARSQDFHPKTTPIYDGENCYVTVYLGPNGSLIPMWSYEVHKWTAKVRRKITSYRWKFSGHAGYDPSGWSGPSSAVDQSFYYYFNMPFSQNTYSPKSARGGTEEVDPPVTRDLFNGVNPTTDIPSETPTNSYAFRYRSYFANKSQYNFVNDVIIGTMRLGTYVWVPEIASYAEVPGQTYVAPSISYTYGGTATAQLSNGTIYSFPGSYGGSQPQTLSNVIY